MNFIYVMIGGFFGAICRYGLGEWIPDANGFPVGTLVINLLGCLFLGWLLTFVSSKSKLSLLIGTGFIGSFTTFSTFSFETIHLFANNHYLMAICYVVTSIVIGFYFVYVGHKLAGARKGDRV